MERRNVVIRIVFSKFAKILMFCVVPLCISCNAISNIGIDDVPEFPRMQSATVSVPIAIANMQRCTDGFYTGKNIKDIKTDAGQRFMRNITDGSQSHMEYMDYYADEGTTKAYWLGGRERHAVTITFSTNSNGIVTSCTAKDQRLPLRE